MTKRNRKIPGMVKRPQPDPKRACELLMALLEGNTSREVRRQQARLQKKLDSFTPGR